jgi:hypothetical protein
MSKKATVKNTRIENSSSVKEITKAELDDIVSHLDENRIQECEKRLNEAKENLNQKVYAVKFEKKEDVDSFFDFISFEAEWKEKEALGIIEICRIIDEIKKQGIKQNTLFLNALPLEASHYFLSKVSGKGLKEAKRFISILKPFGLALELAKQDAAKIGDLEKELAAAQQGLELS